MTSQNILSWNCRGFFAHYEEFELLKQMPLPIAFCLLLEIMMHIFAITIRIL